jgi:hypothetical protein
MMCVVKFFIFVFPTFFQTVFVRKCVMNFKAVV